ncbi:U8 snoRNA-decapping enzyme-like isoform X2 [Argiope bruennichi]|uniref:U8 snoRNA-decapping enzyme like protein n=1 Tax=Argiope bruennichi TaxID=94029 RepID=A0A8T0E497_ARGBR|nr:U8 snoRNA-decapping enzyme-like isoform X2 [Argiope bruennichi]KAF8766689.1 U8 snoRNA-decapping enzyme like protein [Argiope bruennichi]
MDVTYESPGFELISFEKSFELSEHRHAAHCCIYSPYSTPVLNNYVSSALVSMQMRFDGKIGFHGGLVHEKNITEGLNRELAEEINLNEKFYITDKDYLFTHVDILNKLCLHFYGKEVSIEDFKTIEKEALDAEDFGLETMGVFRVPMFTMRDGYRGLPAFLNNNFIGEAKNQLLNFILHRKLMTPEEVKTVLEHSQKGSKVVCFDD